MKIAVVALLVAFAVVCDAASVKQDNVDGEHVNLYFAMNLTLGYVLSFSYFTYVDIFNKNFILLDYFY